ncbi:unnamed protein product [[Candida] boidinii]|nr:unnamed protein product [[Candida] boidinii]
MTIKELVKISNGLFTKNLVNKNLSNKNINNTEFVFKNPIDFIINKNEKWCIIGDEKYNFLRIIKGDFFLFNSSNGSGNGNGNGNSIREYPIKLQDSKFNIDLLKFVNNNYGKSAFGSNTNGGFTHLGARYEFFKDFEIDENLVNFIINKSYNSRDKSIDETKLNYLLSNLKLFELKDKFINSLSNGQFRRARICKSLYSHPNLLLIDDPFLGLDPIAKELVSNVLNNSVSSIEGGNLIDGLCIGLRIQDDIPEWIENVAIVNKDGLFKKGHKLELTNDLQKLKDEYHDRNFQIQSKIIKEFQPSLINNSGGGSNNNSTLSTDAKNENIIEMNGVDVIYKGKHIIKDLKWQVKNGEKWHIRGKNGSVNWIYIT